VKIALNEYGGGIITLERKPEIHPLLENGKKTNIKALKNIHGMRWERNSLDSVGGRVF
jgi:hypothetical protein